MDEQPTVSVGEGIRTKMAVSAVHRRFDVSESIAERLVDRFGSVEAITNAPRDELLEVTGVGPVTATKIRPETNPNATPELREKIAESEEGELIPIVSDEDGRLHYGGDDAVRSF